jgi:hypothetical protein
LIGRESPDGPDLRSITLDSRTYKKGEAMNLRLVTTAEAPLTSVTVVIGSTSDPAFEVEATVEKTDGTAETIVSIPIDDRFKSGDGYVIRSIYAFDAKFDMVSLSLLDLNDEFYWFTNIRPERFTVQ